MSEVPATKAPSSPEIKKKKNRGILDKMRHAVSRSRRKQRMQQRKTPQVRRGLPIWFRQELQSEIRRREEADEALRIAEKKYRSIFEHAIEGIFQTTMDGAYISANPALIRMYGYDSFEDLTSRVNDIARQVYVDPNRRAEFIQLMQENDQVTHFESEVYRKDSKKIWISENVRAIRDENGQFLYYEGTVDNITELKVAREKEHRMLLALEETRRRLENELAEAASYVRCLLPSPLTGSIETQWRYIPSEQLGGDGFGYHWIDPDHLAFYLLDVCGHGVSSALLCISILNVLRSQSLASTDFLNPGAVLSGLNHAFPMQRNNEKYFTIWYGVFEKSTRKLTYSSGGQHPAVLLTGPSDNLQVQLLKTDGALIGVVPDLTYSSAEIIIDASAELFLFSDGVFEIARPDGTWQSLGEFVEMIRQEKPTVEEIVRKMEQTHGTTPFEDDFSLLKIKFN